MFTRLLLLLVVALGGVQSASAQHPRKAFDPNDPEKTRAVVPRAEREQLGLAAKTWDGVVQPEVYTVLERLNETVERARKTNTVEAINTLDAMKFHGTVYVQVHLKNDPEGKPDSTESGTALLEVQRRVLGSLTAAEFHVRLLFERSPGLVGYASAEGLGKLAAHADVVGVCLDDQPFPQPPPVVYKNRLPDAEPGKHDHAPGVKDKQVGGELYQALEASERGRVLAGGLFVETRMVTLEASERGRVFVMVALEPKGEPLPQLTHVPGEMHQRGLARDAAVRKLQERVLSTLSADEFWLWTQLGPGFAGYVNRQGLEKLRKHPEVGAVGLQGLKGHGWRKPSSPRSRRNR